jgi:flavin reductase
MTSDVSAFNKDTFRAIMRRQALSVTIITTSHGEHLHGMTATAFCSVCADPPTVLIVVNRSTRSHPLIHGSGIFVVNILADDQMLLANRFSGKFEDQFTGVAFRVGKTGGPILAGVAAFLECQVISRTEVETHTLFLGRVIDGVADRGQSLVYHDGKYGNIVALY